MTMQRTILIVVLTVLLVGCTGTEHKELDTITVQAGTPTEINHPWIPNRVSYDAWIEGRTLFSENATITSGVASHDPRIDWSLSLVEDRVVWSFVSPEPARLRGLRGEFELFGLRYLLYGWTDRSFIVLRETERFTLSEGAGIRSLELAEIDRTTALIEHPGYEFLVTEGSVISTRGSEQSNDTGSFFIDEIGDGYVQLIAFDRLVRVYDASVDLSHGSDGWASIETINVDFVSSAGMFDHAILEYAHEGETDPFLGTFTVSRSGSRIRADASGIDVQTRPGSIVLTIDRRGGHRLLFDSEFDPDFTHRIRVIAR